MIKLFKINDFFLALGEFIFQVTLQPITSLPA